MWWLCLTNFYKKYLRNLVKYNEKRPCVFHLILVGFLSMWMLYAKSRGIGRKKGFLNRKNLLSMTKVICRQSVNTKNQVINKSKAVYSNDQINTNHRQFSLTETGHSNCKLFSLRQKQLLSFLIFQKIYR